MAEIATFALVRHLRAEPTAHVLYYRGGALARDGAGLAFWIDELVRLDLVTILTGGVAPIRDRIAGGLAREPALGELGLEVVAVRVAAVTPTAEVEKALRQPTREAIQQRADEATFARRALAVEKERAIGENELQNRIELARREEQLVEQDAANQAVEAQATDERARLVVKREADTIDLVEAARRAEAG
jgi:regulator of protease activity HflC (stomatin/prohibitin superfamily)